MYFVLPLDSASTRTVSTAELLPAKRATDLPEIDERQLRGFDWFFD
jgi:hypothetical protein